MRGPAMRIAAALVLFLLVLTSCKDDHVTPPAVDLSGDWIGHDPWAMWMTLTQTGDVLSGQGALLQCDACAAPPTPVTISGTLAPTGLHLTIVDGTQSQWIFTGTVADPNTLVGSVGDLEVTFRRVGACTEIGCSSGLSIVLVPATDRIPEGHYDVQLVTDGGTTASCCFDNTVYPVPCADDGCSVLVQRVGRGKVYVLSFPVLEGTITVAIQRDGELVATDVFQPAYQVNQPNGPDCPPRCTQATHSIDVY